MQTLLIQQMALFSRTSLPSFESFGLFGSLRSRTFSLFHVNCIVSQDCKHLLFTVNAAPPKVSNLHWACLGFAYTKEESRWKIILKLLWRSVRGQIDFRLRSLAWFKTKKIHYQRRSWNQTLYKERNAWRYFTSKLWLAHVLSQYEILDFFVLATNILRYLDWL